MAEVDVRVFSAWAQAGVGFHATATGRTPDLERLIADTAHCAQAEPRLFIMTVTWVARFGQMVAHHRLGQIARDLGGDDSACLGFMLEGASIAAGGNDQLEAVLTFCRPAPRPQPLYDFDRAHPDLTEMARERASDLSRKWNLWTEPFELKFNALRRLDWILENNPSFRWRAVFRGGLRASVLASLMHDVPAGGSEADLARLCGVTRKAVHEALDHLEFCGLIRRTRVGRAYQVTLAQDADRPQRGRPGRGGKAGCHASTSPALQGQ